MPYNFDGKRITAETPLNAMQRGFVSGVTHTKKRERVPTPLAFDVSALPAGSEVLLIRQYGLGDAILMVPLLRAMHARGLLVDFHTDPRYMPLFAGCPYARTVAAVQPGNYFNAADYDAVIDLDRSDEHPAAEEPNRIRHYGRCIGLTLDTPEACRLELAVTEAERAEAAAFLSTNFLADPLPRPWVAYAWGSKSRSRNWSNPVHERTIRELLRAGASVIVLSEEAQKGVPSPPQEGAKLLNLTGAVKNLRRVAALLAACDGVVAPDTGLFHLAAALGKPVAAYFGPFALSERTSGAETALTVLNEPEARCHLAPCHEYECPFPDEEGQSPCLMPEWGRLGAWAKGLLKAAQETTPVAIDPASLLSVPTGAGNGFVATGTGEPSPVAVSNHATTRKAVIAAPKR
jgi:ADP-heptose:LPS heptosyltransferase